MQSSSGEATSGDAEGMTMQKNSNPRKAIADHDIPTVVSSTGGSDGKQTSRQSRDRGRRAILRSSLSADGNLPWISTRPTSGNADEDYG